MPQFFTVGNVMQVVLIAERHASCSYCMQVFFGVNRFQTASYEIHGDELLEIFSMKCSAIIFVNYLPLAILIDQHQNYKSLRLKLIVSLIRQNFGYPKLLYIQKTVQNSTKIPLRFFSINQSAFYHWLSVLTALIWFSYDYTIMSQGNNYLFTKRY